MERTQNYKTERHTKNTFGQITKQLSIFIGGDITHKESRLLFLLALPSLVDCNQTQENSYIEIIKDLFKERREEKVKQLEKELKELKEVN